MRFAKILLATLTSLPASAQVSMTGLMTTGADYRTIDTPHFRLKFPADREPEARLFAQRAEGHLAQFGAQPGVSLRTNFNLVLTERRFANAYVMPGFMGSEAHSTLPFHLNIPYFSYAGFDGGVYDVFVHEFAHYYQYSLNNGGTMYRIFGPFIPFDMLIVPSWVWEGYAVQTETNDAAYKGRLKPAMHPAMVEAVVDERGEGLAPWDFSVHNKDWMYSGGSQYVVGSLFMRYLTETYGDARVRLFLAEGGSWNWSSDFHLAFGKGFRELVDDMNVWLAKLPRRAKPAEQRTLADLKAARMNLLTKTRDGTRLVAVANFEDDETRVLTIDAQSGQILQDRAWTRVLPQFLAPGVSPPTEGRLLDDGQTLAFLGYRPSRDFGVAEDAVLGLYDTSSGSTEIVAEVPDAITGTFSPDGTRAWYVRRLQEKGLTHLELWRLDVKTARREKVLRFEGFETVSGLTRSPDDHALAFTAARPGGSWNVYAMKDGEAARVIDASVSQELDPQWGDNGRLYYLSDRDNRFDVVSREVGSPENSLCLHTRAPYLTSVFTVGPDGKSVYHDSRTGRLNNLEVSKLPADCTGRQSIAKEDLDAKPAPGPSLDAFPTFEESAWNTLIPVSRLAIPFYIVENPDTKDEEELYGLSLYLAGESPYKKVSWNFIGSFGNRDDLNQGLLSVSSTAPSPLVTIFGLGTQASFYDDDYRLDAPRYTVGTLALAYPLYNHMFTAKTSYRDAVGERAIGGVGISHAFSAEVSSLKAAGPKRGYSVSEDLSVFPDGMGTDDPMGILRLEQSAAASLGLVKGDSFRLEATELFIDRRSGVRTGYMSGPRGTRHLDPEARNYRRAPSMTAVGIPLRGFGSYVFQGNKGVAFEGYYGIPLYGTDAGTMHLWNRMWLHPSFTNLEVGPFLNAGTFLDQSGESGDWHSATGLVVKFQLGLIDVLPISVQITASRRLTDDRKGELAATLFGSIPL